MRVALVILHADPARGGAERYTADIAEVLAKRGHVVSVLASDFPQQYVQVNRVVLKSGGMTRLGQYQQFLDSLDEHLASHSYDIVHAMLPVRRCDLYHPHAGIAVETPTGLKAVFNPRRVEMAKVERELLTRADSPTVLILSDYVKQFVTKHYPSLPDIKLQKLFNSVDLNRFHREEKSTKSPDEVVALVIAQDFERKGVPQAIEATKLVNQARGPNQPRVRLMIVGKEHAPGVEGDVSFVGETSNIREIYASADFFLLPTRHDPCSLVVLEALAMGLPVITTRQNGAAEIMTEGREGFVLERGTVPLLAEKMKQLLDPQLRKQMREAALSLRPRLSQEQHVNRLLEIYESTRAGSMRGARR
ncbi:MAG TPA: glycosyltransferase family 4 protein [Tepidisphaeraceae bacterium]|jgi:UDP-glucose:(heptosyl)LPS alpha-1,3-glucosyltransferase|nr:glycosyltransferase family 4 protein [Tepidisphaeraceae bacterium]